MARSIREKIALIVLALLIVLISVCACAYMSTGTRWTLAASYVDDTVGSMDGYTVIVYAGTVIPEEEESDIPVSENGLFGESEEEVTDESQPEDEESDEGGNNYEGRFLPLIQEKEEPPAGHLYVSEVRSEYLSKDASVLTLDTNNLAHYSEPGLYIINGKRVAVFSAEDELTEARYNVFKQLVSQMDADIVMCVTPRLSHLPTVSGIDIVLLTTSEDEYTTIGSSIDETYILSAPEVASVGVIIITPNNVASSKVVDASQSTS